MFFSDKAHAGTPGLKEELADQLQLAIFCLRLVQQV